MASEERVFAIKNNRTDATLDGIGVFAASFPEKTVRDAKFGINGVAVMLTWRAAFWKPV